MIHGRYTTYVNYACHCPACKAAWATYSYNRRVARQAAGVPANVKHGSNSTYTNWRCHCDACKAAHNTVKQAQRAVLRQAKIAAALLES